MPPPPFILLSLFLIFLPLVLFFWDKMPLVLSHIMLKFLREWMIRWKNIRWCLFMWYLQVELICRISTVLLQTHHNQLVTTPAARPALTILRDILYARIKVRLQLFVFLSIFLIFVASSGISRVMLGKYSSMAVPCQEISHFCFLMWGLLHDNYGVDEEKFLIDLCYLLLRGNVPLNRMDNSFNPSSYKV